MDAFIFVQRNSSALPWLLSYWSHCHRVKTKAKNKSYQLSQYTNPSSDKCIALDTCQHENNQSNETIHLLLRWTYMELYSQHVWIPLLVKKCINIGRFKPWMNAVHSRYIKNVDYLRAGICVFLDIVWYLSMNQETDQLPVILCTETHPIGLGSPVD